MDQLLLQVLSFSFSPYRKSFELVYSAMGNAEIQKVTGSSQTGLALAWPNRTTSEVLVSTLASRLRTADWDNGSPVS
jgi:hypothetical protein